MLPINSITGMLMSEGRVITSIIVLWLISGNACINLAIAAFIIFPGDEKKNTAKTAM